MSAWPKTKLGQVLNRVKDEVWIQNTQTYTRLTIRMNGNGIAQRDRVPGYEIGTKKQFVARTGQLVLSKIDARNGAFGVLPAHCDNAIITGNFWAFDANPELLLTAFFDYLTKTPMFVEFCVRASEGTTNRRYLQEDRFLAQEIPLPPLAEQRRVVARIEELAAQVHEARSLRQQAAEEAEAISTSWLNAALSSIPTAHAKRLGEVVEIIGGGTLPAGEDGYFDVLLVKVSDMNRPGNEVCVSESAAGLSANSQSLRGCRVVPIDSIIFPKRGGAIATNKKRVLLRPAVLDPNMMGAFSKNAEQLAPSFLFNWLRNLNLASLQTGTSVPQINKGDLEPLIIPVPPVVDQRRIVAELDALQAEVDALKRYQAETAAELDALLPAILDRAFKGELFPPENGRRS